MFGLICGVIGINLIYGFYGQEQLLQMKFVFLKLQLVFRTDRSDPNWEIRVTKV